MGRSLARGARSTPEHLTGLQLRGGWSSLEGAPLSVLFCFFALFLWSKSFVVQEFLYFANLLLMVEKGFLFCQNAFQMDLMFFVNAVPLSSEASVLRGHVLPPFSSFSPSLCSFVFQMQEDRFIECHCYTMPLFPRPGSRFWGAAAGAGRGELERKTGNGRRW